MYWVYASNPADHETAIGEGAVLYRLFVAVGQDKTAKYEKEVYGQIAFGNY